MGFFSLPLVFSFVAELGSAPVYVASFHFSYWVFPLSIGGVRGRGYVRVGERVVTTTTDWEVTVKSFLSRAARDFVFFFCTTYHLHSFTGT